MDLHCVGGEPHAGVEMSALDKQGGDLPTKTHMHEVLEQMPRPRMRSVPDVGSAVCP